MHAIVLMSTYNGEAYLDSQIRSILDQDFRDFTLMIRDDGSSDDTVPILERFSADPRIHIELGENVGLPQAFFELMHCCPDDADLYLLSDQDDIWHRDKIAASASYLCQLPFNSPALYCSRLRLISEDGTQIGLSPRPTRPPDFGNALIENICTGCTIAFNGALLSRLKQTKLCDGILFHDWWAYLVAAAFGTVVFDNVARIDYRLHGQNVTGMPVSGREAYRRRIGRQRIGDRFANLLHQAEAFLAVYGNDIGPDARKRLHKLIALKDNRGAAFSLIGERAIFRQARRDDLIWRLALALYGAGLIGNP